MSRAWWFSFAKELVQVFLGAKWLWKTVFMVSNLTAIAAGWQLTGRVVLATDDDPPQRVFAVTDVQIVAGFLAAVWVCVGIGSALVRVRSVVVGEVIDHDGEHGRFLVTVTNQGLSDAVVVPRIEEVFAAGVSIPHHTLRGAVQMSWFVNRKVTAEPPKLSGGLPQKLILFAYQGKPTQVIDSKLILQLYVPGTKERIGLYLLNLDTASQDMAWFRISFGHIGSCRWLMVKAMGPTFADTVVKWENPPHIGPDFWQRINEWWVRQKQWMFAE